MPHIWVMQACKLCTRNNRDLDCLQRARDASEVQFRRYSAYGERKTVRILTASRYAVNTTKPPVMSRASAFYLACGHFKQTFVLALPGGVDILRSIKRCGLLMPRTAAYKKYCEP